MAESPQTNQDSMLARLVVEQGLATDNEVRDCMALVKQVSTGNKDNQRSLLDILVSNGIVTKRQIDRLRPPAEDLKPNQQIPGFQILERLGAGAMATVFKAKQVSLDRMVAIKVLPKRHTSNPEFVERFYAEGRAAAKLNHANIVGALDVGKAGEFHYFVMEYVEGKTLHDDLLEKKRYEETAALRVMHEVALALEHAHKAGFIHRDVKPKNIMLTAKGTAKLADMGLARAVSDREAAEAEQGKAYGTPYYISPEQIRGELDIDFRADIYSYGATFYHVLTGQVPFDGPNPSSVMFKHLKTPLTPPDQLNPKLSVGISEIIEVCMAKDRNKRYKSTSDLLEDIDSVMRGEPPLQARSKVDLSSLTSLESSGTAVRSHIGSGDTQVVHAVTDTRTPVAFFDAFTRAQLFWFGIVGWVLAVLMLIVAAVMMTR